MIACLLTTPWRETSASEAAAGQTRSGDHNNGAKNSPRRDDLFPEFPRTAWFGNYLTTKPLSSAAPKAPTPFRQETLLRLF
jgi:hypothetical protein